MEVLTSFIDRRKASRGIGLCVSLSFLLISSCASTTITSMVPSIKTLVRPVVKGTVRVVDVEGGGTSGTFGAYEAFVATSDEFRKALILAVEKAGIFGAIKDQETDFDLLAEIKHQETRAYRKVSTFEVRSFLTVTYQLIDRKDGRVIWQESYNSESGYVAFGGATGKNRSHEGCVRESLASFISGISSRPPSL